MPRIVLKRQGEPPGRAGRRSDTATLRFPGCSPPEAALQYRSYSVTRVALTVPSPRTLRAWVGLSGGAFRGGVLGSGAGLRLDADAQVGDGSGVSPEAIAIAGVGVALLAVLVPVVVLQSRRLEQRIDAIAGALTSTRTDMAGLRTELRADVAELRTELRTDVAESRTELRADIAGLRTELRADMAELRTELRADMAELRTEIVEVRRDLRALAERVARIEGALTGPWRPTNGSPAPASKTPPQDATT